MSKVKTNKKFWDRYAKLYDYEVLRYSGKAYQEIYKRMGALLTKDMQVLELATGTGLIATNIAGYVGSIEATDFSPKMIAKAMEKRAPANLHFSVEDATDLSFPDQSFDAVIISNALHIMPDPKVVLAEIKRVLKPGGWLIAPTFSHGHIQASSWNFYASFLRLIGFETYSKWLPEEYVDFIRQQGFAITDWDVLTAAFPLVYLEAQS